MDHRTRVGVIFGGRSGEHEVSIESAKSILAALDLDKYDVIPLGVRKTGQWTRGSEALGLLRQSEDVSALANPASHTARIPIGFLEQVDVVIPVLHGSYGEDGTIQGLLELLDVAYVGAGVLTSAVGMDKVFMKRMFAAAGLPQVDYTFTTRSRWEAEPEAVLLAIEASVGYPCFVKPANLGSSVGISKAKDRQGLSAALELAAQYDRKIVIEQGLDVREIEVAVLGNDQPQASVPGEVVPSNEFYDYTAKYGEGQAKLVIPAPLPDETAAELRRMAIRAFLAVDGSGLARVDFFMEKNSGRVLVNEINTMPGFTRFSMYPKLWEASGLPYADLLDQLIALAIARHRDKQRNLIEAPSPPCAAPSTTQTRSTPRNRS